MSAKQPDLQERLLKNREAYARAIVEMVLKQRGIVGLATQDEVDGATALITEFKASELRETLFQR